MAAGFITKSLSTLLSTSAKWFDFGDGTTAPVSGSVQIDSVTGLPVVWANASLVRLTTNDISLSATSATTLGVIDCSDLQSLLLTVSIGTGNTVLVEGNNDNGPTWYGGDVKRVSKVEQGLWPSIQASDQWIVPKRWKYTRIRVSSYSSGTVSVQVHGSGLNVNLDNWQGPTLAANVRTTTAANANLTSVKSSLGYVKALIVSNTAAAARWVKIFDAISVTMGTTAAINQYLIPAGTTIVILYPGGGKRFNNAIQLAVTTAEGLTDNTVSGIATGDVNIDVEYA